MSIAQRIKRPRVGASPTREAGTSSTPLVALQDLGHGVYRVGTQKEGDSTVADADYYKSLWTDNGALIVDNSADLGRFEGGLLLQADSRFYLGFASASQYSVMQVASSLEMFHDISALESLPSLQTLSMTTSATNARPATHICLRFEFPVVNNSVCPGAIETLDAVENYIEGVVRQTIRKYFEQNALPLGTPVFTMPTERSPDFLSNFLNWMSLNQRQAKVFISVHQLQRVLQRPLDAAVSNGVVPFQSLDRRLDLIRRLFLMPIWTQLASPTGVVRKFLIVGPYFIDELIHPPSRADFPGLPAFKNLSSFAALHGFTSSQIRILKSLPEAEVPTRTLEGILRFCNISGRMDSTALRKNELREIFPNESVQSVFAHVTLDSAKSDVKPPNFDKNFAASYKAETLEPARRALFPLFLRHTWFRTRVLAMLSAERPGWTYDSMGPTFKIADIIDNEPSRGKTYTRLFMLGLMSRYERPWKKGVYSLAGGCARAMLQSIADETSVENYAKPYQRRKRTRGDNKQPVKADETAQQKNAAPPPVADEDLPALNIDSVNGLIFTETSIANLILDHYRPTENFKQLPVNEAEFQETFVQLLRAALLREGLPDSFVHHVQVEVWLRRRESPPGESHNIRCDVIVRISFGRGTHDYLYIFELKYFNLGKTMTATHKKLPSDSPVLLSKSYADDEAWIKAYHQFLRELASIRNLPPHWYVDVLRSLPSMAFPLSIDHLHADYEETLAPGLTKANIKKATVVATDAVEQVEEYRDVAILGVADELVNADQLLPDNIEKQLGWADQRITDLGPGKTTVVPFVIVNVAGALVYVHKLEEKEVRRRIGIVDAHPWTKDPDENQATVMKNRKAAADRQKACAL